MVADMEVDILPGIEVDKVAKKVTDMVPQKKLADMEVDKVTDIVADKKK